MPLGDVLGFSIFLVTSWCLLLSALAWSGTYLVYFLTLVEVNQLSGSESLPPITNHKNLFFSGIGRKYFLSLFCCFHN
jgi:hypothetical protein